jgi:glycosyltransferase involved in cell wall biosynthesis
LRILVTDQFSDPGGAQLCLLDVMQEGLRRGWQMMAMLPGEGCLHERCRELSIATVKLPLAAYRNGSKSARDMARYPGDVRRSMAAMRRTSAEFEPDVVYLNGPRVLPLAREAACPVVFHAHSRVELGYARAIARWSLRPSAREGRLRIVAAAEWTAAPFRPEFTPLVIYNGVADAGFCERGTENMPQVGMLGRIAPEKGHFDFLRTVEILRESGVRAEFSITGGSFFSSAMYEAEVRRAGEALGVRFYPWTENVSEVLHRLDLLVLPSKAIEATPRVIPEAFSAGTVVAAYPSGGIPELIHNEETGMLVKPASPDALATVIRNLLENRSQMQSIALGARRAWEERFRRSRFQEEVCCLVEEAANHRMAGPNMEAEARV